MTRQEWMSNTPDALMSYMDDGRPAVLTYVTETGKYEPVAVELEEEY